MTELRPPLCKLVDTLLSFSSTGCIGRKGGLSIEALRGGPLSNTVSIVGGVMSLSEGDSP